MKTLIIHPEDWTTKFLDVVYAPIEDKTVITGGVTKQDVKKLIESHDRVMMLGHGSPHGLFACNRFPQSWGYVIDYTMVEALRKKQDNVFIWCNADIFVNFHDLKGFYSGMFISEVAEAEYCRVFGTNQNMVDESNHEFCRMLSEHINNPTEIIHENVTKAYGELAQHNLVAEYNSERLYKRV